MGVCLRVNRWNIISPLFQINVFVVPLRKCCIFLIKKMASSMVDGAVASRLVRSPLDRAVLGSTLAGDIVFLGKTLYSHSASLHSGAYMDTGELNAEGNPTMDYHRIQGGGE